MPKALRFKEKEVKIRKEGEKVILEPLERIYAIIRAQLERKGVVIPERDTQIAAIALANKRTVVTHNVSKFCRIEKLAVEDWATE